jgi:hypothetical protein
MSTNFQAATVAAATHVLQERRSCCRRASQVGRRAILLKRQKKIAGLTRRSFCRRSWGRPPTVARLLPFPFSVVPGAQPCPFSFVSAPTLSDASDMFDFPYRHHSRYRSGWKSLTIKAYCGTPALCDVINGAVGKFGLKYFGQNATNVGCR